MLKEIILKKIPCPMCNGEGVLYNLMPNEQGEYEKVECPVCCGLKEIWTEED